MIICIKINYEVILRRCILLILDRCILQKIMYNVHSNQRHFIGLYTLFICSLYSKYLCLNSEQQYVDNLMN